jgi:phosphatidylserine synthase
MLEYGQFSGFPIVVGGTLIIMCVDIQFIHIETSISFITSINMFRQWRTVTQNIFTYLFMKKYSLAMFMANQTFANSARSYASVSLIHFLKSSVLLSCIKLYIWYIRYSRPSMAADQLAGLWGQKN